MTKADLTKEEEKLILRLRKDNEKNTNKKSAKKKRRVSLNTLTKKLIVYLVVILCLWVTWTYGLVTFCTIKCYDITVIQALCDLSGKALEVILGSVVCYLLKSLRETRYKEDTKLEYARNGLEYDDIENNL